MFSGAGKDGNFICCVGKGGDSRRNSRIQVGVSDRSSFHHCCDDVGGENCLVGKRNSLDGLIGLLDSPGNLFFFVVVSVVCQRGVIGSFGEEGMSVSSGTAVTWTSRPVTTSLSAPCSASGWVCVFVGAGSQHCQVFQAFLWEAVTESGHLC